MEVISRLASSLGNRDEQPNMELAQEIADKKDKKAVKELVDNLANKSKAIKSDCIKTLYEIGERNPSLIADHSNEFIALLDSKDNRMQWGAMTALNMVASVNPKAVYPSLTRIVEIADNGSVITRDHAVGILVKLCGVKEYSNNAFALLNEQLLAAPTNQLPMYAELALPIINDANRDTFIRTLTSRLDEIEKESKRKRVEKVLKKVGTQKAK